MCLSICREKHFPFSGLQKRKECHCGFKPEKGFDWSWPSKCSNRCSGDKTQNCGGINAISVWSTPSKHLKGLCVYDFPSNRVLGGFAKLGINDLTIEKCRQICSGKESYIT